MAGPIFAMFQLLTGTHPQYALVRKDAVSESEGFEETGPVENT